jgi:hypothetical protein
VVSAGSSIDLVAEANTGPEVARWLLADMAAALVAVDRPVASRATEADKLADKLADRVVGKLVHRMELADSVVEVLASI